MKPTQEQVIAWAREAGFKVHDEDKFMNTHISDTLVHIHTAAENLAALAYEAGQESMKWDGIHSCHPDCQRPACVHTRKTYQEGYEAGRKDENEACAKVCEDDCGNGALNLADAIRARREQ